MSLKLAEVFPPGEFIKDALDERGWTQQDLADIMGRPLSAISDLVSGKRGVTADTANGLAAAFDTSPDLWLNLESKYRLSTSDTSQAGSVKRRARIYQLAPVREMIARGWIGKGADDDELEANLCKFFRVTSLEEEPECLPVAARKSTSYQEAHSPAQRAWIQRVSNLGSSLSLPGFSQEKLKDAVEQLRAVLGTSAGVAQVPSILAEAGVAFVVVKHLAGTKIDGACIHTAKTPIIALSLRYGRIDHFWFVLMHEIGHLVNSQESIDENLIGRGSDDERPREEIAADTFSASTLVDQERLEAFVEERGEPIDLSSIRQFAQEAGVHPAIVIGQLQHRGLVGYNRFRRELIDVRTDVVRSSISDGWEAA